MGNWTVVCDDVLHWAENYSGPPFHAILTDPPYHLTSGNAVYDLAMTGAGNPRQRRKVAGGGFMGKKWDGGDIAFDPATWAALAAHLLPGAHVLAFGGSRTHHRLMVAIEDAGLEIRDCIYWAFGSGFPKSLAVGKAIDRAAKAEREVVGNYAHPDGKPRNWNEHTTKRNGIYSDIKTDKSENDRSITAPATPAAATWEGYGSALKPAVEVIVMARKPLEGTIAANCERYGSGALWIDGARIGLNGNEDLTAQQVDFNKMGYHGANGTSGVATYKSAGRWPANLVLQHSPGCKRVGTKRVKGIQAGCKHPERGQNAMSDTKGMWTPGREQEAFDYTDPDGLETVDAWECAPGCPTQLFPSADAHIVKTRTPCKGGIFGGGQNTDGNRYEDMGSAARFFFQAAWELDQAEQLDAADVLRYAAKASRAERDAGLDTLPARDVPYTDYRENAKETKSWVTEYPDGTPRPMSKLRNAHPTVKPLSLCRYLATLLLPPAAYAPRRILVPFSGVGSEMIGAGLAGWDEIVGIEQELEYTRIAEARLAYWLRQPELALR